MFHSLLKHSATGIEVCPAVPSPDGSCRIVFGRVERWCPRGLRVIRGCGLAPPPPASDLPGETTEAFCPEITPLGLCLFLGLSSSEALSLENQQSPLPGPPAVLLFQLFWRPSWALGRGPLGSQGQVTRPPPACGLRAQVASSRGFLGAPSLGVVPRHEHLSPINPPGSEEAGISRPSALLFPRLPKKGAQARLQN